MTKEQAYFLSEILEEDGQEVQIMEKYSGRYMYGEETYAIIMDSPMDIVTSVLCAMRDFMYDPDSAPNEFPDFDDFNPRIDSMGKGFVIY